MAVSLQDGALTTLSAVLEELGAPTGADDYLKRQINRLSDLFEEATGREWYRDPNVTESVPSVGDTRILISRPKLRSVSQIEVQGDTVDAGAYEIEDADAGIIRLDDAFWESTAVVTRRVTQTIRYHEDRVEVTYDAGYVTPKQVDDNTFSDRDLPHHIEGAIIDSVATKFRRKGQPSDVQSESIGSASVAYKSGVDTATLFGQTVSSSFVAAAQRHRDRSVLP